jgi:hypothetical protein
MHHLIQLLVRKLKAEPHLIILFATPILLGTVDFRLTAMYVARHAALKNATDRQKKEMQDATTAPQHSSLSPSDYLSTSVLPCLNGVETFAAAALRISSPHLRRDSKQRPLPLELIHLSATAVQAEKLAELFYPPPALPQRLGLKNGNSVVPVKRRCSENSPARPTFRQSTSESPQ